MPRPADCPVCGTVGVYEGLRCSSCSVYFVCPQCRRDLPRASLLDPVCPSCGVSHEIPAGARQAYQDRRDRGGPPLAGITPAGEPGESEAPAQVLLGPARAWLATLEPGPAPGVRAALAGLARAYRDAGRPDEAARQYRLALAADGSEPPEAALRAGLAVAQLAAAQPAGSDPGEGIRNLLLAVNLAAGPPGLVSGVLTTLTADAAASLAGWLSDVWLPAVRRSGVPPVLIAGLVLQAAALLLAGRDDDAVTVLTEAGAADPAAARTAWDGWAQAAAEDGGTLAAARPDPQERAAVLARAAHALGQDEAARRLADQVIAASAAAGTPQVTAYRLRAQLPGRSPQERAADLVSAVGLLTGSNTRPELELAVTLLDEAGQLDPRQPDVPWYRAEITRLLAYQNSPSQYPVLAELEVADRLWEAARRPGRPDTAWPWLVRAQICGSLAEGDGASARIRWHSQLAAATEAAHKDPQWSACWAAVAAAARRLLLVQTSGWALGHCKRLVSAPDGRYRYEAQTTLNVASCLEPRQIGRWVEESAKICPLDEAELHDYRALALMYEGDPRGALRELTASMGSAPRLWQQIFRARLLTMAGDDGAPAATSQALQALAAVDPASDPLTLLDRAILQLYGGHVAAARELTGQLRALGPETSAPAPQAAAVELLIALTAGDEPGAARSGAAVLDGLYPELASDLRVDLEWLTARLRPDAPAQADRAQRWLADLERAQGQLPAALDADAGAALTEVDTVLAAVLAGPDQAPGGALRALGAVRALIADDLRGLFDTGKQPSDAPDLLGVEVGPDLLPAGGAAEQAEWPLITVLLPQLRDRIQQRFGYPNEGVQVRDNAALQPAEYVAKIDGRRAGGGVVPAELAPHPPLPVSQYPGPELWQPAVDALESAIAAAPAHCLTPSAVSGLLEQWQAAGGRRAELAARFGTKDLGRRVRLWRALVAAVERDGRLPAWDDGLGDLVAGLAADPGDGQPAGTGPVQREQG